MPVEMKEAEGGKVLEVHLTGRLVKEDYEQFVPMAERLLKTHDKIRMLVEMHDFHGWTASALWEDIKFDAKHFNDIEQLAIAGDKRWHHGAAVFCKPFTAATIRYFDIAQLAAAQDWLRAGL
jgi:SpoIIAA-like